MYNKIWLMVPTYKRPEWLVRLIVSAIETAENVSNIGLCICYNVKDKSTVSFLQSEDFKTLTSGISLLTVEESTRQPNLSLYFNMMYDEVVKNHGSKNIVSMIGDDMVFVTKGYDRRILDKINETNGRGIVWCNDDYIAKDKCPVNLFVTTELVQTTGKPFMCPEFRADMIDVVWGTVAKATGLQCYLGDVVIKHLHSTSLPAHDDTFQRLAPIQKLSNGKLNHVIAQTHAMIISGNLIAAGVGEWQ